MSVYAYFYLTFTPSINKNNEDGQICDRIEIRRLKHGNLLKPFVKRGVSVIMEGDHREATMRHCPACRSVIDVKAVVCRFCGRNVPPVLPGYRHQAANRADEPGEKPAANELHLFLRDLQAAASRGLLEPTLCRDAEIDKLLKVICSDKKPDIIVTGPDGVGKTNLIYGAATVLLGEAGPSYGIRPKLLQVYPGVLEGHHERIPVRLKALVNSCNEQGDVVVFLDDFGALLLEGTKKICPASQLFSLIDSGQMQCVVTMNEESFKELRTLVPQWISRSVVLELAPPDAQTTLQIMTGLRGMFEKMYGVKVSGQALASAVQLAQQYLPREEFPGKAVEVIGQACNRYRRKIAMRESCPPEWLDDATMHLLGIKVGNHDVKRAVSEITAIDIDTAEADRWQLKLEERLGRHIISQEAAVKAIAAAVTQLRLNFGGRGRPAGVILLAGHRGVGKLRAARVLARQLLGNLDDFVHFNMAYYAGKSGVERFFGTAQDFGGDLGSGVFAQVVRDTPLAIVTFDGIENGSSFFIEELLRGVQSGCIRDNRGQRLELRKCLMILTVNTDQNADDALVATFGSSLGRRLCEAIPVHVTLEPLTQESVLAVLQHAMQEFYKELRPLGVHLHVQGSVYAVLSKLCYSREWGLEGMNEKLEKVVFKPVRNLVREGPAGFGSVITVMGEGEGIRVNISDTSA